MYFNIHIKDNYNVWKIVLSNMISFQRDFEQVTGDQLYVIKIPIRMVVFKYQQ